MTRRCCRGATALAVGIIALPINAMAQDYNHDPFFAETVVQSQAFGLEMIGLKLDLAETFTAPVDHHLAGQIEGITGVDLARFIGTLESRDAKLAGSLKTALGKVEDAVREGRNAGRPADKARHLLKQAYDKVISPDVRKAPDFQGAVMVQLLLAEGGVSEAYQAAVEDKDVWKYPVGWAALQRAKALWSAIKDHANDQRRTDAQEMIDALDKLFPNVGPPASVAGWNSEGAEDPAQRLSGIVEEASNANLYPDRDLPRLAGHLADITAPACKAYAAGKDEVAAETIYAAFDHYGGHIRDTLTMFSPEDEQSADKLFGALITVGDDDDNHAAGPAGDGKGTAIQGDDGEAAKTKDDDDDKKTSAADSCMALQRTLLDMQKALGGN